jgi:hypothetical protein
MVTLFFSGRGRGCGSRTLAASLPGANGPSRSMRFEYDRRALEDETMAAVAFDTLKFARTLREKAKVTSEQAEGVAHAFAEARGEQIATKSELREEIAPVKADLLLVKWMMDLALAFQVAIFAKTFIH